MNLGQVSYLVVVMVSFVVVVSSLYPPLFLYFSLIALERCQVISGWRLYVGVARIMASVLWVVLVGFIMKCKFGHFCLMRLNSKGKYARYQPYITFVCSLYYELSL